MLLRWCFMLVAVALAAAVVRGDRVDRRDEPITYQEPPMLRGLVEGGKLAPVAERVPEEPLVARPGDVYGMQSIGRHGGTLKFNGVTNGYASPSRGMAAPFHHDDRGNVYPFVFKGYRASDDKRTWTILMRRGMRWSDGHPFTADDVVFWYKAEATNRELSPLLPLWLTEDDRPAKLEKVDDYSFRVAFKKPHLRFATDLAMRGGAAVTCPKHYLRQYHPDYIEAEELRKRMNAEGMGSWMQLWEERRDYSGRSNPDLPALNPWVLRTSDRPDAVEYVRNRYYWIVDSTGQQLPYVDRITYTLFDEADWPEPQRQMLEGKVSYGTLPQEAEPAAEAMAAHGIIRVGLAPPPGDLNAYTLTFNFLAPDPFKAKLINDRRFRIAMSLQMPRDVISRRVDGGKTEPKQIGISDPDDPWSNEKLATAYLEEDVEEANRLLDEIGLVARNHEGVRLNPDGDPIVLSLMAVQHQDWSRVCRIIADHLPRVGLLAEIRFVEWVDVWSIFSNGQWELWLTQDVMGYPFQWPCTMRGVRPSEDNAYAWSKWMETRGREGTEPPELMKECWRRWEMAKYASTEEELTQHIQWLQTTAAKHLWAVGITSFPPTLRFAAPNVRNVPFDRHEIFTPAVWIDQSKDTP